MFILCSIDQAALASEDSAGGRSAAELEAEESLYTSLLLNVRERDGLNGRRTAARTAFDKATAEVAALTLATLPRPIPDYFAESDA